MEDSLSAVLTSIGVVLVAAAIVDAVVTTLAAGNGGGPLTTRLTALAWRLLRAAGSDGDSKVLRWAGTVVLLVTVLAWVTLLWTGWVLIFASSDDAVVDATTSAPASVAARVYYAAFVVFTLGIGDFVPGTGTWQVLTGVASFLGLFVVTLSITYLVSVVSAAVSRRSLARNIHLSGETGLDIVRLHWNGDGISGAFSSLAQTLSTQILQTAEQHLAYPVLHHFHAAAQRSSAPRSIAALDDALLILSEGLVPSARPDPDTLVRLRRAIEHYVGTIQPGAGRQRAHDAPLPSLAPLREAAISTVADAEFTAAAEAHRERRQQLDELVRADAWTWPAHH